MSFNNISGFSEEYKLIRYNGLIYCEDQSLRVEGYKNVLESAEKLKWTYFIEELLSQIKNDTFVFNKLKSNLPNNSSNFSKITSAVEMYDNYFHSLNHKDLQVESVKVKEYAKQYFDLGCFGQFISVFNRFLVFIKNDFTEADLHQYIVRYVTACVIKRQFDLGIAELSKLKHSYNLYDISIYVL
jgi:hypothetical protein